ncbi:piggyBac transposable element-derived protein 4-like [Rana temporaria]|uniref:piggyBac transposable element-derived protein 4-like n=1 Tax=Rana temporaria TaxID=8407 RepID=UPI001AACD5E7|nr:piggyBac transposable element-derived protein 4-like [Rana temporaria]
MSRKLYTTEEAFKIITQSDESSGELSPPHNSAESTFNSGSEYEPPESSTSESEEEVVRPKRPRSEPQAATSSAGHPSGQSANANGARPQEERLSTSSGIPHRGRRAQTHLPDGLANPLWLPSSTGSATIPPFTAQPGVQANTEGFSEIDFFNLFFPNEFLQTIIDQTNLFASQYIQNNPNSYYARPFEWRPLTMEEMRLFLGLTLNMGLSKKNELHSYWSKKPILHMPIFSATMSRSRYDKIIRFLHFCDNSQCPPRNHTDFDRLYKIRPLIDFFNEKFAELYIPEQNISVDESLVHFTGRLGIKQYIPSKRARYGLKLNKLCESSSGYVNAFRVYEGKDSQIQPPECPSYMGISGKIVWELAFPLFQKGYHIYVDNYYTSLPLFRHLFLNKTLACGTSRKNRKGFPQSLVTTCLQKGESVSLRNEEVLALKWRDKKDVYMMLTIHNDTSVEIHRRRRTIRKPCCINEYNKFMGGGWI